MENSLKPIFIADDDRFHLEIMRQLLKTEGKENIHTFENGAECLNQIHLKPEIVFLDHRMDIYSGYETLRKIKRFDPDIFVVIVSAQEDIKTAISTLKHGAIDYIQKDKNLEQNIKNVLANIENIKTLLRIRKPSLLRSIFNFFSMKPLLTLLLLTALFFVSCRTSNILAGEPKSEQKAILDSVFYSPHPYHIRKDDKITISIWGQDNLSVGSTYGIYNSNEVYGKWLMVDASGNIEIPKIGRLRVENMTIIQLKDSLRILFGEWVKTPIIDIKILNRSIMVLGEVRDPQTISVDKERTSLLEALAICKGVDFYANLKSIKVFRQVGENVHVASIDLSKSGDYRLKNITLYPGDVVIVPSKKYKAFDKRISTIIPFTTTLSAAAILLGLF